MGQSGWVSCILERPVSVGASLRPNKIMLAVPPCGQDEMSEVAVVSRMEPALSA
jgi:uncharacterized membrane protein AbrB (regulator of aidB expression)